MRWAERIGIVWWSYKSEFPHTGCDWWLFWAIHPLVKHSCLCSSQAKFCFNAWFSGGLKMVAACMAVHQEISLINIWAVLIINHFTLRGSRGANISFCVIWNTFLLITFMSAVFFLTLFNTVHPLTGIKHSSAFEYLITLRWPKPGVWNITSCCLCSRSQRHSSIHF